MLMSQTVFGIIGNVISMGLFLSPLPTFHTIYKAGSTLEFSVLPYGCTLLNCMLWFFYGSPWVVKGVLVMSINGFGTVVELLYLSAFLIFARDKKIRVQTIVMIGSIFTFFAMVASSNLFLVHQKDSRKQIIGILCVLVGTAMYAAPLSVMKNVIETKSTKYMPFYLSLFSFLNGVMWFTYALIGRDVFIAVPNGLGTLLASIQLILFACYCRNVDAEDEPELSVAGGKGDMIDLELASTGTNEKLQGPCQ